MILTHHGMNSLRRGGDITGILIIDHIYPVTKIGNLYWTTKNCFERVTGVEVIYPNGDSLNEEKNGLLYKAYDMFNIIIPLLPTGWRVPTREDFFTLADGDNDRTWNAYLGDDLGGQNKDGLNIRLNGWRSNSGTFSSFGNEVALWTSTAYSSSQTRTMEYGPTRKILSASSWGHGGPSTNSPTAEAIRFVRDV